MQLDVMTLLLMAAVNTVTMSALLPLVMGRHLSRPIRYMQFSLVLHAISWVTMILAEFWRSPILSTLSTACTSAGLYMVHMALTGWLGKRPAQPLMLALTIAIPVGYGLTMSNERLQVCWSNVWLGLQMLLLSYATQFPAQKTSRGWRNLLGGGFIVMAGFALTRGVLGAMDPAAYANFALQGPFNIADAVATNLVLVLSVISLLVAWHDEAENRLRLLANTDMLTKLPNRRGWTTRAQSIFANAQRAKDFSLAAVVLDLDHFKRVNDTHGHEMGDKALQLFARVLEETMRAGDLVGRIGGEEFCLLMMGAKHDMIRGYDGRLRACLLDASQEQLGFTLNYSAGLAVLTESDADLPSLISRADIALYEAKSKGRGQLVTWKEEQSSALSV